MTNVISLFTVPPCAVDGVTAVGPVAAEVVIQLRNLLEMAENGKLKGFAIAMVFADGRVMCGHAPDGCDVTAEMIGSASALNFHLVAIAASK